MGNLNVLNQNTKELRKLRYYVKETRFVSFGIWDRSCYFLSTFFIKDAKEEPHLLQTCPCLGIWHVMHMSCSICKFLHAIQQFCACEQILPWYKKDWVQEFRNRIHSYAHTRGILFLNPWPLSEINIFILKTWPAAFS